jgi:hypothetical protein
MAGDVREISVRREHRQIMMNAKLCEQRIHRFDLHAGSAATVAHFCGLNVIVNLWHQI